MIKVLYIDDEPINLDLFYMSFRKDFEVLRSESPLKGLDILDREGPDILITDQRMPVMTGIDLIREVKRKYPDKKCILLTAYYEPELCNDPEFREMVYRYLEKPFKRHELRQIIEEAVA